MNTEELLNHLEDLKKIGVMAEGEPEDGERTWYLTETGVAWAEGEIELSLQELAENEDVQEEDLNCDFETLKGTEKVLKAYNGGPN